MPCPGPSFIALQVRPGAPSRARRNACDAAPAAANLRCQLPHRAAAEIVLIGTRVTGVVARAIERAIVKREFPDRCGRAAFRHLPQHLLFALAIHAEDRAAAAADAATHRAGAPIVCRAVESP